MYHVIFGRNMHHSEDTDIKNSITLIWPLKVIQGHEVN